MAEYRKGDTVACVKIDGVVVHIIEFTDGDDMSYIYEGGGFTAFVPMDSVEDCVDDIVWVAGGGTVSEEEIEEAVTQLKQQFGDTPPTIH